MPLRCLTKQGTACTCTCTCRALGKAPGPPICHRQSQAPGEGGEGVFPSGLEVQILLKYFEWTV